MRKTAQAVFLTVLLFVLASLPVAAQLRPRTTRPRAIPPAQPAQPAAPATTDDALPTAAQPTSSLVTRGSVDDGFTWFQAVATEALGQNNIP